MTDACVRIILAVPAITTRHRRCSAVIDAALPHTGFAFALCEAESLKRCAGRSRSLALDLFDQWEVMEKTGQFRFTPPTHVMLAFRQALTELDAEGGAPSRLIR